MTPEELLQAFHTQIRLRGREDGPRPGMVQDEDGPVRRAYPVTPRTAYSMIECPSGLGEDPERWITRQREFFSARGEDVEWKTYSYDQPADLAVRLRAAGFVPEDDEALMLGETAVLRGDGVVPDGVTVREVRWDGPDVRRIGALHSLVWGPERASRGEQLAAERRSAPARLDAFVAEGSHDGPVLCAAWVRYSPGTKFCSMWGGATHPDWRRRGLYRALLERRAARAQERGFPLVRVDASTDSEPVLTRLGLLRVATTTPYVLRSDPASVR